MSKHYLAIVNIVNGEYSYVERFLFEAENTEHGIEIAKRQIAKGSDNQDSMEESDSFYFNNGEVCHTLNYIREIPESDYEVLRKYI